MSNGYTHDKNPDTIDDKELFEYLVQDLKGNFELLMRKYSRLCASKAMIWNHRHPQNAEDCVQKAFIKAYISLEIQIQQHKTIYNLKAWLLTILYHICVDAYNTGLSPLEPLSDLHLQLFQNDPLERPENAVETAELHERIMRTIDRLPKIYQEMIRLHCIGGLSMREIHNEIYPDMSIETVKSRVRQAKDLFRIIWENDPDEEGK
jgi:RNA polymerase sigma factor (sigma-70 family)